jgi:acetoacetyl-CoA synthetase
MFLLIPADERVHRPIVHRAGGMLLQSLKEHRICADMGPADTFFYYTTTYVRGRAPWHARSLMCCASGWMMWNYLVSALAVGATLVLYDGSPLRQPELLWTAVDDLQVTIFGTSAKYLEQLAVRTEHSIDSYHSVSMGS